MKDPYKDANADLGFDVVELGEGVLEAMHI